MAATVAAHRPTAAPGQPPINNAQTAALHGEMVSGATAAPWRTASGVAELPYPKRCSTQARTVGRVGCVTVAAGS